MGGALVLHSNASLANLRLVDMFEPELVDGRDASMEREGRWFRVSQTLTSAEGRPYGCAIWDFSDSSASEVLAWAAEKGFAAYSVAFVDEVADHLGNPSHVRLTWLLHHGQPNSEPWDEGGGSWSPIEHPGIG